MVAIETSDMVSENGNTYNNYYFCTHYSITHSSESIFSTYTPKMFVQKQLEGILRRRKMRSNKTLLSASTLSSWWSQRTIRCSNVQESPSVIPGQLPVESNPPTVTSDQFSVKSDEFPVKSDLPSVTSDQLPVKPDPPSVTSNQLTVKSDPPSVTLDDQLPVKLDLPTLASDPLSVKSDSSSMISGQLPVESDPPSVTSDSLPVKWDPPKVTSDLLMVTVLLATARSTAFSIVYGRFSLPLTTIRKVVYVRQSQRMILLELMDNQEYLLSGLVSELCLKCVWWELLLEGSRGNRMLSIMSCAEFLFHQFPAHAIKSFLTLDGHGGLESPVPVSHYRQPWPPIDRCKDNRAGSDGVTVKDDLNSKVRKNLSDLCHDRLPVLEYTYGACVHSDIKSAVQTDQS